MSKKITLTLTTGSLSKLSVDEIKGVYVIKDSTFIVKKDGFAFYVKESKSRVLKMIETAK